MRTMLQVTDTLTDLEAANRVLDALRLQAGYEFGRVMPPSGAKPGWRVQAFMVDGGEYVDGTMENVRRVRVPEGMERLLRAEPVEILSVDLSAVELRYAAQDAVVTWNNLCNQPGPPYDPTNESLLAKAQAGEWFSRHDLVLDPAVTGDERQAALADRERFLRSRA